jgi:hypothetical protein
MEKKLKNIQTFEQHTDKNLNISDVIESKINENMENKEFEEIIQKYIKNNLKINIREESHYRGKDIFIDLVLNDEVISTQEIFDTSQDY